MEGEETENSARISPHAPLGCAEIYNPLSSFPHPDPFPVFIIPGAKAVPLVPFKTPLFLIADKVVPAQM